MGSTEVVTQRTQIPSKWDIIPIHASDVSAYKRCRRYWDWTSPTRNNLRRRVDISGVKTELWFGTGIHYALEMYYDPILQRDPVEAFQSWYELQWNGGIVGADFLERTYDASPRVVASKDEAAFVDYAGKSGVDANRYQIKGLRELLPNVEVVEEEFEMHRILGVNMLTFYKEWAAKNDDFVTVAAEDVFSIPLGFEAMDIREESPNYGKLIEVHVRGKRDAILYWPDYDRYGINDHKTAKQIDETYFAKLEKDEQCSTYLWATIMESLTQDRPWSDKPVDRVLYTALRKRFPVPPTRTYGGKALSVDRANEATTAELFEAALKEDPVLQQWFLDNGKAQNYYTYLCEEGDELFIKRDVVTRNKHEILNTGEHLKMIAQEMVSAKTHIYPNPTGSWLCTGCAFRVPCIAADDGSDWKGILADGYEVNRDR